MTSRAMHTTIAKGEGYRLFSEMFGRDKVYLELKGVLFQAGPDGLVVEIPAAAWEAIRSHGIEEFAVHWFGDDPDDTSPGMPEEGVRVVDIIEVKESFGDANGPGIVAILEDYPHPDARSFVGRMAIIRAAGKRSRVARIVDARDHGKTISLLFKGLSRSDIPIGATVTLG